MRIAQVACVWPPYGGGVGVVASEQAKGLVERGHTVTVFTPAYHGELPRTEDWCGVKLKFLPPRISFGNSAWLPQLNNELADFDIIHLHLFFGGSTNPILRWAKRGKPLVVQYHNDLQGEGLRRLVLRTYSAVFLPRILTAANVILGLSAAHVESSDLGSTSIKLGRKVTLLPNGVDVARFSPNLPNQKLRAACGLGPGDLVLLFVAGLDKAHYFKGLPYLLQAVKCLISKYTNLKLLVVGDGELKADYIAQAEQLGINKQVRFLGSVPQKDLPEYYRLADIFVLPSTAVEAFPVAVLEAMASGLAVVTSTLPGPRAVIDETGLSATPADAQALAETLDKLLSNQAVRQDLGQKARLRVEQNFSWPTVINQLENIYKNI